MGWIHTWRGIAHEMVHHESRRNRAYIPLVHDTMSLLVLPCAVALFMAATDPQPTPVRLDGVTYRLSLSPW